MLYFSRLDTLRLIAFGLVFWTHNFVECFSSYTKTPWYEFFKPFFDTGTNGVHIFFVISGFLITFLLIQEYKIQGQINVRNFYLRRILRIWPLYYLIMILGLFILPNLTSVFKFCGSYWLNLTFLNNFNVNETALCHSSNILIAWSVAIEEQFYLFWPICFSILYKRKLLELFCIVVFFISVTYHNFNPSSYFDTIGNLAYLMIGCLGAMIYDKHQEKFKSSFFQNKVWFWIMLICLLSTVIFIAHAPKGFLLKVCILPFFYLYFVLYSVINNSKQSPSVFSFLGKYTYGMYLYHPMVTILVRILFDKVGINYIESKLNYGFASIVTLILTILISIFSYNYFEGYFLKFKHKLAIIKTRI
jgi:peptidoglycan/LPS O-acetylase OafA/YrhL